MEYSLELQKKLTGGFEGFSLKPYKDTRGFYSWGFGRCYQKRPFSDDEMVWLLTKGPTVELADACFSRDINEAMSMGATFFFWSQLNTARKLVIVDMLFNLGKYKFLEFHRFLSALMEEAYLEAANEMIDSFWYKQVGQRGVKLVEMMRSGEYEGSYHL